MHDIAWKLDLSLDQRDLILFEYLSIKKKYLFEYSFRVGCFFEASIYIWIVLKLQVPVYLAHHRMWLFHMNNNDDKNKNKNDKNKY